MPDPTIDATLVNDLKPTIVTVSSMSGTGTGGLVKSDGHPIMLQVVKPITMIGVRALRVFIQTLLGLLSAGSMAPTLLPFTDFWNLLGKCASLSMAAAVICILQNMVELLTKADQASPTLTV